MFEQISLFDEVLLDKKVDKPIRLISFFSGIEAQYKALSYLGKKLGISVESYKTCEWAYNSIVACNSIHNRDFTDYSENKSREEMIEHLKGISINYNEPLTDEQLNKKPIEWIKNAYNNCIANHNLINIMNVHGADLECVDHDKYEYILTYSFPCQDLSLAGARKGMSTSQSDGGTRSGLLWEVERILKELDFEHLPEILLMENVPQVHSEKDYPDFKKWMLCLEELGYTNYFTDLNAKDYGIPQNRERTFMISLKRTKEGDEYKYYFPIPFRRKHNLKDLLESNVDEKYYLTKKMISYLTGENQRESEFNRAARFEDALRNPNEKGIANCVTTLSGQRPTDNFIVDGIKTIGNYSPSNHNAARVVDPEGLAPTVMENHGTVTAIVEKYSREALNETLENGNVEDGDFIDVYNKNVKKDGTACTITTRTDGSNNYFVAEEKVKLVGSTNGHQSGNVYDENGLAPTLTACDYKSPPKLLIKENTKKGYLEAHESDGVNLSSRMQHQRGNVQKGCAQTLKTKMEVGVVVADPEENLKEQLCNSLIEQGLVKEGDCINHSYANSRMDKPDIANKGDNGCSPTLTTRPDTLGITVEDQESLFSETEKQLFTDDGNVRRYIGSEQIDKMEEGDMATTTFPNGYGHGPRTHKDCSVTLNTIDKPVVKHNLRIRKLTPHEAMRLMGFQDIDTDHMFESGLSNAAIFHCAGDSICVNVLIGIFAKVIGIDNERTVELIKEYIETIKNH